jgi:hypothetical protein
MQRMLEFVKPTFRRRTLNVSIALATVHVLSSRNWLRTSGEKGSVFMSTPVAETVREKLDSRSHAA